MNGSWIGVIAFVLIVVVALQVTGVVDWTSLGQMTATSSSDATPLGQCEYSPNVSVQTPDLYGGAAVTTKNVYRLPGGSWTEVGGTGGIEANHGDSVEVVFGIGTSDEDDEPYGCHYTYTVPCKPTPILSAQTVCTSDGKGGVIDDSVEGDLTVSAIDPEDGNVITAADPVDIDNGDIMTIDVTWSSTFEQDFGNRYCYENEGEGNVLVIHYNNTQYTSIKATDTSGNQYPPAEMPTGNFSAASGYVDRAYEVPPLKSNADWDFRIVADASGAGNAPDGGISNVTLYLYDVNYYLDNDFTPAKPVCAIEDENAADVGSAGYDELSIPITND